MNNKVIRLTENDLKNLIKESVKNILNEGINNDNYTHFAVNKKTNLIVNGWDYSGYDGSELRQYKKDYFMVDLIDYGFNPKEYKILTLLSVHILYFFISSSFLFIKPSFPLKYSTSLKCCSP